MKTFTSLFAAAAVMIAVSAAPSGRRNRQDPCGALGRLKDVANCYHSIEYNATIAHETISALHTLYNDFFVFRDAALTPNLAAPFSTPPVDIIGRLAEIEKKAYTRDYDFQTDIMDLSLSLNDAHLNYIPTCYNAFPFQIAYNLYAPAIDGKQTIRIYSDLSGNDHEDCEVLTIDGEDARTYIQNWADKYSGISKDPGVRFNFAFVNQKYSYETHTWGDNLGSFSVRTRLPSKPHLDFKLNCGVNGIVNRRTNWIVANSPSAPFNNKETYLNHICYRREPEAASGDEGGAVEVEEPEVKMMPLHESPVLYNFKREFRLKQHLERRSKELERRAADDSEDEPVDQRDLPEATFVASSNQSAVYQLKSKPHVGILVVPSMEIPDYDEVSAVQQLLVVLADNGVTNIVIDLYGNGGGYVFFAQMLPMIFFPTTDKKINSHLFRYRVTPAISALAEADFLDTEKDTYWEPTGHGDKVNDQPYTTNFFTQAEPLSVNQRTAEFTPEVYLDYNPSPVDGSIVFPWTNDPSKITILTDGQCGSACGMTTDFFVARHGVKAVAVGGHSGSALSMFSFAGASVLSHEDIIKAFEELNLPAPMGHIPYSGVFRASSGLAYTSEGTMLEYDPSHHSAAYRLDYTPDTARHHDQLWDAVADVAWAA
ncbi:hypothetical protein BGZ94_000440 [Podila epigama]|nr:hypothetical protein BGZ94_000440 [Podila epigama]